MRKFLKKQFIKLLIYIIILGVITILFFYCNWNKNTLLSIISLITSIFIAFMGKTWIDDYKLEIDRELENHKLKINKELESYKIKLSNYTLVTKLQYDLEFSIYREIYGDLMMVLSRIERLSNLSDSKDRISLLNSEKNNWYILKKKLELKMLQNAPFYSEQILDKISSIIEDLNKIVTEIEKLNSSEDISLFLEGIIVVGKIKDLGDLIKDRIENMKIIEN
ncbi:hypothetical protein [Fusobacterium sp. SYSU M8D902]|uniref:hypothetical protein n=1 Tax=Fusobacterium sp. SYSU M8D902 TaxID=3159562 RepID=UPI0032E3AF6F